MKKNKIRKIALAVLELLKESLVPNQNRAKLAIQAMNELDEAMGLPLKSGKEPSKLQHDHRGVPIIPLNGQTIFKQGIDAVQGKQLNMIVDRIVTRTGNSLDGIPVSQGSPDL